MPVNAAPIAARIANTLGAELEHQVGVTDRLDILAHHEHARVATHLFANRLAGRFGVRDLWH